MGKVIITCAATGAIHTPSMPPIFRSHRMRSSRSGSSPPCASHLKWRLWNMGSFNFALFPMLNRFKQFKHQWERDALEGGRDLIFRNTFKEIEYALAQCATNDTRFEFECYDVGHLYNLGWRSARWAKSWESVPAPSCGIGKRTG